MDKETMNDVLRRNVALLSKQTEKEVGMMPATEAPLPSVGMVKEIVVLVKNIIFPDYFNKRQPDERTSSSPTISTSDSLTSRSARIISVCTWSS